jgi:hypothetical protein
VPHQPGQQYPYGSKTCETTKYTTLSIAMKCLKYEDICLKCKYRTYYRPYLPGLIKAGKVRPQTEVTQARRRKKEKSLPKVKHESK